MKGRTRRRKQVDKMGIRTEIGHGRGREKKKQE
jgi:hypothetical protein